MAVKIISGSDVESNIGKGTQIVNIFGTWCGPCQMLAPVLEEISEEFEVFKIDIDTNRDFSQKMQVQGVPATFIYKDGILKDSIMGFLPKVALENKIKSI